MTNLSELKTLGMSIENDYGMEDDFEGLSEGFHVIEDGWDEADFEEEDEDYVDIPLQPRTHILDRRDSIIYGGFVRHKFYKETGGKKPFNKVEENSCGSCNKDLSVSFEKEEFISNSKFDEIYFKEIDADNEDLSEIQLALLQLYDWVGVCTCNKVYYGFFEKEKSLSDHVNSMVEKAKNLSAEIKRSKAEEHQTFSNFEQMDLFDFLEEEVV